MEWDEYLKKKKKWMDRYRNLLLVLFFGTLFTGCIIGFLFPLRPKVSETEKRELTKIPELAASSFVDGSYFKQLDTWYADTYPFRDRLLEADSAVTNLYGIQSEQLHGSDMGRNQKDDIPAAALAIEETEPSGEGSTEHQGEHTMQSEESIQNGGSQAEQPGIDAAEQSSENLPEMEPQIQGTVYQDGSKAYGLYYFNLNAANTYIKAVNRTADNLKGISNVYDMVIPNNSGVLLEEGTLEKLGCSSQRDAVNYYQSSMGENVRTIPIFDTLLEHKDEYLYFSTDHHWTALGAYYSYREWAKIKGAVPHELKDYEQKVFPGFTGSYYSSTQSQLLKDNPDTVYAYVPLSTNFMQFTQEDGLTLKWNIVNDVSNYNAGEKYACFAGGDNPYSIISNPCLNDSSSCLIIKESFGNALIPFLVDHYRTIHIIDYRYYKGNILNFVKENNIKDVLFVNNIEAISSETVMNRLDAITQ